MRSSSVTLKPEIGPAEMSALLRALHLRASSAPILEIGTAAGGTLREMMHSYPTENRPRFVVVDPMTYFPDQLSAVRRNLASVGIDSDTVEFRVSKSWPAFKAASRACERYSLIFVDGSHKANRVMQDVCWARLLEPGGFLCFHDYLARMPGVMFAVNRLLANNSNYAIVEHVESTLILRKMSAGKTPEVRIQDLIAAEFANLNHKIAASLRKRIRSLSGE
jgi:predicted O-methyltransferase YrrM